MGFLPNYRTTKLLQRFLSLLLLLLITTGLTNENGISRVYKVHKGLCRYIGIFE